MSYLRDCKDQAVVDLQELLQKEGISVSRIELRKFLDAVTSWVRADIAEAEDSY